MNNTLKGNLVYKGERGEKGEQGNAGVGIAAGGTIGQVLIKTSDDDYVTGWETIEIPEVDLTEYYTKSEIDEMIGVVDEILTTIIEGGE